MKPKQKALEFFNKMNKVYTSPYSKLTSEVKELCYVMINELEKEASPHNYTIGRRGWTDKQYWGEVKQELEKL